MGKTRHEVAEIGYSYAMQEWGWDSELTECEFIRKMSGEKLTLCVLCAIVGVLYDIKDSIEKPEEAKQDQAQEAWTSHVTAEWHRHLDTRGRFGSSHHRDQADRAFYDTDRNATVRYWLRMGRYDDVYAMSKCVIPVQMFRPGPRAKVSRAKFDEWVKKPNVVLRKKRKKAP